MSTERLADSGPLSESDAGPDLEGLGLDSETIASRLLATRQTQEPAQGDTSALEPVDEESLEEEGKGEGENVSSVESGAEVPGGRSDLSGGNNRGRYRLDRGPAFANASGNDSSPRTEAREFMEMVRRGKISEHEARKSIDVPLAIQDQLRAFAVAHKGQEGAMALLALDFRRRTLTEFERLLALPACSASPVADRAQEGGVRGADGDSTPESGPCDGTAGEVS